MYVAVKGGDRAIENSQKLLAEARRGDPRGPEVSLPQIQGQMPLAVDRVMTEGSLYDPELAALAIKQARGDLVEAIFLLRAYRTTLPRFGAGEPLDTAEMAIRRRISATYKDLPGGQLLGGSFDYTHRLLDFALAAGDERPVAEIAPEGVEARTTKGVPVGDAEAHVLGHRLAVDHLVGIVVAEGQRVGGAGTFKGDRRLHAGEPGLGGLLLLHGGKPLIEGPWGGGVTNQPVLTKDWKAVRLE